MKKKTILYKYVVFIIFSLMVFLFSCGKNEELVLSLKTDTNPGPSVQYALGKFTETLRSAGVEVKNAGNETEKSAKTVFVAGLVNGSGKAEEILKESGCEVPQVPESYIIKKMRMEDKTYWIVGGYDDTGLMYGLLDVAGRIGSEKPGSLFSNMKEAIEEPVIQSRAISLYTMNRSYWESRFYNEAYWDSYLDMLARYRFNSLVLIFGYENGGFLAPCYPYFFDVEGFPDVKMVGISEAEQQKNLSALNRLIEQAHVRGIRFSVGIWDHIYRGGVQGGGIPGAGVVSDQPVPGLVWGLNGKNLMPYTKAALAKFVRMIPGLDGIQFRMHDESGLKKEEQEGFWAEVFGLMKSTNPEMRLDLRAKGLPDVVIQSAIQTGINFRITTKYWMEQMGLPFHPSHINKGNQFDRRQSYADMLRYPKKYNMHWRFWTGGTSRILLWGDPEYGRRFAESTLLYDGVGFEVNEPLATKMLAQPHDAKPFDLLSPEYRYYQYEFERYWPFFLTFGRVGYNPETAQEVWNMEFDHRFGKRVAPLLQEALQKASQVLPRIVASCYPYIAFPTTRGWAEKQRLGNLPLYAGAEGSDIEQFANFDEEALLLIDGGEAAKIRPPANSLWFRQIAADVLNNVTAAEKLAGKNRSKEFTSMITDLKILSHLALYHAERIPAAVNYRLFERTKDATALDAAIVCERNAVAAWKKIVESAGNVYTENLAFGVHLPQGRNQGKVLGFLDGHWKDELAELEKGLTALEQQRQEWNPESKIQDSPHLKTAKCADNSSLFKIIHQPVSVTPVGKPVEIKVKVTAANGLKWIRLRFRNINQHLDYQILEMKVSDERDAYQATLPADRIDPKWDLMYFIEVMDKKGNGFIFPDLNKETPYINVKLLR